MFITEEDILREGNPQCRNEFFSSCSGPHNVAAEQVILVRATIEVGAGHDFHYHEEREEFLYILNGEMEQWVGKNKRFVKPGDVIFIPPGVVHASFNIGDKPAKILAIFGNKSSGAPLAVEVSHDEPWSSVR